MKNVALIFFLLVGSLSAIAQVKPDMNLHNVITQKSTPIAVNSSNLKGLVIVFMSNECPFSLYYINRLKTIESQYKNQGVQLVYVNSFMAEDESITEMATFGKKHKLSNYLADKNQYLKKQLGVRKTPEIFLLKKAGNQFTTYYRGPIDNNAQVASDVKFHFLKDNINNLLSGKSAVRSNTPVMGCIIK